MALGITWTMPDDDRVHMTKNKLLAEIAVFLGGRVAEEIIFGDVTTGASNDLERLSKIARKLVTAYGMSDTLGLITFGQSNEHRFMGRDFGSERDYSEEVATSIDREVKRIVDEQYHYVKALIVENRDVMDAVVKVLLERETIDDKEFLELMATIKAKRSEQSTAITV
jgi:cell division protease FtsH